MHDNTPNLSARLVRTDRAIEREKLAEQIRAMGGIVPRAKGDDVSEIELTFLRRVVAWETGTCSTHREWLARRGLIFAPPGGLRGPLLTAELGRLLQGLAEARVFLYHTNHLSDAELYAVLWNKVLDESAPDFARTPDDGCHCDLAEAGAGDEGTWLTFYASEEERREWARDFPDIVLPARRFPPHRRDHLLPVRD